MDCTSLLKKLKTDFKEVHIDTGDTNLQNAYLFFLQEFENLLTKSASSLSKTQTYILFEGFYQYVYSISLKNYLCEVRSQLWIVHLGVPTLTFLISYQQEIRGTQDFFVNLAQGTLHNPRTWLIEQEDRMVADEIHPILIKPNCIAKVVTPHEKEVLGVLTKTYNPHGGFTTTPSDPVSQQYLQHAALCAQRGDKLLEIGAAFGTATLEALATGATVFCNDIDPANLAVICNRYLKMPECNQDFLSSSGDCRNLVFLPGNFPFELKKLPHNYFTAILICRVLHFFPGVKIEESFSLFHQLLAPGGKLYVVCETPYLKNWQTFIPEFNLRVERGEKWPGEITNTKEYESSRRSDFLPKFVNWLTQDVLERCFQKAGFAISHSAYINRAEQFPEDLVFPEYGKESIGMIGCK